MSPSAKPVETPRRELIVDRFEAGIAVVEVAGSGGTLDIPRWLLPANAKEGDVIRAVEDQPGSVRIVVDVEETALRRANATAKVDRLRDRDPGGDIKL